MKNIFVLIILAGVILSACGPQSTVNQGETIAETFMVSELVSNPLEYEDLTVRVEGIISHICRGSGDKLFIVQEDDHDFSIRVMLGDFTGTFSAEDEGREIAVTGLVNAWVRNIDELEAEDDHDHDHDHDHEDGHECSSTEEAARRLKARGIDPDIRVFIDMISYDIK